MTWSRYLTGTGVESMPLVAGASTSAHGWVQLEYCCMVDEEPPCSGVCSEDTLAVVPLGKRYVSALYKVFNALEHTYTSGEQAYAVFAGE
jgi:hypothetical protein